MWAPIGQTWPGAVAHIGEVVARHAWLVADAGDVGLAERGKGLAVDVAADHRLGQCDRRRIAIARALQPAPEAAHVLVQLAEHQVAAVAPEVAHRRLVLGGGQRRGAGRACGEQRTIGVEPVLVGIAEQELAGRDQVVEVHVGIGAGRALVLPVDRRLRRAVDETERLAIAHVAAVEDLRLARSPAARASLASASAMRPDLLALVEHRQQHMRLARAAAPGPVGRIVGADIAEAPRARLGSSASPTTNSGANCSTRIVHDPSARRPAAVKAIWRAWVSRFPPPIWLKRRHAGIRCEARRAPGRRRRPAAAGSSNRDRRSRS